MTLGQRIKTARHFRGITQKEFGKMLGYTTGGDVRVAQYEKGTRTPKENVRRKMAEILCVSPKVFSPTVGLNTGDLMETIFWLEDMKGGGDIYDCFKTWEAMKKKIETGEISEAEYLEWKLTWQ